VQRLAADVGGVLACEKHVARCNLRVCVHVAGTCVPGVAVICAAATATEWEAQGSARATSLLTSAGWPGRSICASLFQPSNFSCVQSAGGEHQQVVGATGERGCLCVGPAGCGGCAALRAAPDRPES
jgi:hypothetical protein